MGKLLDEAHNKRINLVKQIEEEARKEIERRKERPSLCDSVG